MEFVNQIAYKRCGGGGILLIFFCGCNAGFQFFLKYIVSEKRNSFLRSQAAFKKRIVSKILRQVDIDLDFKPMI